MHRVLAFAKRTATCALAVHHNGALGLLAHLRQLFMVGPLSFPSLLLLS